MEKKLIIVESPTKVKTIKKFLENDYEVKASMGHLRDLPKKKLGVDVENDFEPEYVTDRKKAKIVKELKTAAKNADKIYLASDYDREGEAIAWHLIEILKKEIKNKEIHRITFNEITKTAIQKAIKKPGKVDQDMVDSQQARRILDRIVGYDVSPLLWRVIAKNLSAGRVQSVALRIICEREEEITNFIPKEFWKIYAHLFKDKLEPFRATLTKWNNKKAEIYDKEKADEIIAEINKNDFIIDNIKSSSRKIQPLPPYITSTLQQDASRILYFSGKKTMSIAQKLYEGIEVKGDSIGLITYMRTDSLRIANEALDSCRTLVMNRFGTDNLNPETRVFKTKSSAQDAHEAIRPTDPFRTPESLKNYLHQDKLKLYTLIWQRFIATQMIPISVKTKNIQIQVGKATFEVKGSTILNKGFSEVFPHTKVALGENIAKEYTENDKLKSSKIDPQQKFTQPLPRYSEASLIKELEANGIGRPSTYASITNTIRIREYVLMKERKFHPTQLGMVVNKFLTLHFSEFFNVKFTAEMESGLDEIKVGKIQWQKLLRKHYDSLKVLIGKVNIKEAKTELQEKTEHKCEKCGNDMIIKWGKNGQFLACSNFPKCKNIKNFKKDEAGNVHIIKPETLGRECPKCGSELIVQKGRYGKFIGCSNFPKCKHIEPITLGIKCPDCEDGEVTEKKNKKGRYFYSCTNYPNCEYITNFKPRKLACPECGNYYMEEKYLKKNNSTYLECPKCGKKVF